MSILLGFLPFAAYALLDGWLGTVPAMILAAAIAAVTVLRDLVAPKRKVKLLELGTVVLFGGLAAWVTLSHGSWSVLGVRLRVDAGLLAIVLISLAVRQPFTLQYAKERTPPQVWRHPGFLRANDVLTAAWALAFACMVAADVAMVYVPGLPLWVGVAVTVFALVGAARFTAWYPTRLRRGQQAAE